MKQLEIDETGYRSGMCDEACNYTAYIVNTHLIPYINLLLTASGYHTALRHTVDNLQNNLYIFINNNCYNLNITWWTIREHYLWSRDFRYKMAHEEGKNEVFSLICSNRYFIILFANHTSIVH